MRHKGWAFLAAGLLLAAGLVAAAPAPPAPAEAPVKAAPGSAVPVPRETLLADLAVVPQKNFDRAERLVQLFKQTGLKNVTRQSIPLREAGGNVMATLPGETLQTIVVGAHLDHSPVGTGAIDNWTGIVCMVNLGRALSRTTPHHTLVFVGFDLEERGQAGSRWYLSQLTAEQKRRTVAMVNLECLGISTMKVWLTGSADALEQLARTVAEKEKQKLDFRQLLGVSADADSFMAAGIASITFDSLEKADFALIDSPKDQPEAIHPDRLDEQYRFILKFLQALDEQPGAISPANKDRPAPDASEGGKAK
ncbi:MAG: DUF4910 domain-containing protein [Planctomycetota bacterium]|nr:DUF4910 domain-containing protein [Planctomycetota bacterium]